MIMQLPNQIETISIARAANAAHYEYLDTVRKRTEEIRLDNELWKDWVINMIRTGTCPLG